MTTSPEPQARDASLLEYLSVAAFFAVCAVLGYRALTHLEERSLALTVALVLVGYLVADLVSGLVHWAFDTWGSPTTPLLGAPFILPFRVHHTDPKDITRHGFVATNGNNCFVSLFVLVPALVLDTTVAFGHAAVVFAVALCLAVFATNQFHKWAHADVVSPVVAVLQRFGLILSPTHHDVHHHAPYAENYCITSGWWNPLLGRLHFFRGLERVISALTRATPRRSDLGLENSGSPQV